MKITTTTAVIPYTRVELIPPDELEEVGPDAELVAEVGFVVLDDVDVTPELTDDDVAAVATNWFAGQLSPHVSLASLHPKFSWPHWGSAGEGAQFPVSIPPVSRVWPLSLYVVAAYPEAEKVIRGADEASVVGVHPFR